MMRRAFDKDGSPVPQIIYRKRLGRKSKRIRVIISCGDCRHLVDLYGDNDRHGVEISGVMMSNWRWERVLRSVGLFKGWKKP